MSKVKSWIYFSLSGLLISMSAQGACPAPGTGIVANGTVETESGCTVTTAGATPGADASFIGVIQLSDSTITTTGNGGTGARASVQSTLTFDDVQITTSGQNANGIEMTGNSNTTTLSNNSSVDVTGTGSNAVSIAGNNNDLIATDTTFSASNDTIFEVQGVANDIRLTNVTAEAAAGQLLMNQTVANSTLNFTVNGSQLSGDIVNSGFSMIGVLNSNTTWTGAAQNITDLTIGVNSTWNVTADSTISNRLSNSAGLINFVPSGNTFKTLTTNTYIGTNGTISLNTFLGTDGSPSDLLIINGGTATGTTLLDIKNTTGPGAQTVGNGILVVEAINNGTTAPNLFTLSHPVVAGPYEYSLFRGGVNGTDPQNWYLRTVFHPTTSHYSVLPSMALLYGRALLDPLHRRVGEEELLRCNECLCSKNTFNGFWARIVNAGGHQNHNGVVQNGPKFNYHFNIVQLGVDVYRQQHCNGHRDHAGLLGAAGHAQGKIKHTGTISSGRNCFDGYTIGAYWTHFGCSGWYLDGVFATNFYCNAKSRFEDVDSLKTHGVGVSGSMEGGYPIRKFRCFVLEPQAQLAYQSVSLKKACSQFANVGFRRTQSTAGRVGARLSNTWSLGCLPCGQQALLTAWLCANVWHDFQGNSATFFDTSVGPLGFVSNLKGTWLQADLGFTSQLTNHLYVYGTLGGNTYFNGRGKGYTAIAGVRANF